MRIMPEVFDVFDRGFVAHPPIDTIIVVAQ
jgi:hypothetical protein